MQKRNAIFLFLTVKSPFTIAVYDSAKHILIEKITCEDAKASDVLPSMIGSLLEKYEPILLLYSNGPGNQMSIKISYVCLKTVSIAKNIALKAASSFAFNGYKPIELINKRFFCFENDNIAIKYLPHESDYEMRVPEFIDCDKFSSECEPIYIMPPA